MILIVLAILAADPATMNSVFAAAKPGDTVRLVAGSYPYLYVKNRNFSPPVIVDASAATLPGVQFINSSGIQWSGGTIAGDATVRPAVGWGFIAKLGANIDVAGVHFSDLRTGIVYDRMQGGQITGNWMVRMSADGIDIPMSRNLVIARNACSDFRHDDASHPDCIQMWSNPAYPPVADITITDNTMIGVMQGVSLFNHVRSGVNDGGFDRITITNNNVLNTMADGISVYDCRGCTVRYNTVASLPNYINVAQLYVSGGSVSVCGNTVVKVPRQAGPPCAKGG